MTATVTVVIAAYNAQASLARAIRSALEQPETSELIVVDDASGDETCTVAQEQADRDPRVQLIRQSENQGPAAARNRALDAATGDYIAVLDSDDVFLPGRLGLLLSCPSSEIVADNIAFVNDTTLGQALARDWSEISPVFNALDLVGFVRGNLRRPDVARGELGFLKPILSRAFLNAHKLRYDPALRLGEDYDLYVRMMLAGGRMSLTCKPGYAALVRAGSLSAQHGAAELTALHIALAAHLDAVEPASALQQAMQAHLREVRHKRDHRVFLDLRKEHGNRFALRFLFGAGDRARPVVRQVLRDKLNLSQEAGEAAPKDAPRLLLPPSDS